MGATRILPCDPLRQTFFLVIISLALLFFTRPSEQPSSRFLHHTYVYNQSITADEIPGIWAHFGCRTFEDVRVAVRTIPRKRVFEALVDHYLAPWSNPIPGQPGIPINARLLDSMEIPLKASTGRIRMSGDGRVLYRVVEHWEKTYRLPRFEFLLDLLAKTIKRNPELRTIRAEMYVNTADGPRSTVDSISQDLGALPILGFRSEVHHIDIPIPDPVEHGSHVTGAGYVIDDSMKVSWRLKEKKAVFRGVASCIQKQHFQNWQLSPRVRVSSISSKYPHLLDAGITKWIKLSHNTTVDDIEQSANITVKPPLSLQEQLQYRYILDVDGGLGSSRKRWMLLSGSVPFFQQSAVYQWYEPLLVKWVHFVPIDRWFRDLIQNIEWARQHDVEALQIAKSAQFFAWKFLSQDAIIDFLAVFLQKYSELQPDARSAEERVPNPCSEEPSLEHGPMSCATGWYRHVPGTKLPFGCRHKPLVEGSFVCHRPHPQSGKKQVKHGVYAPYPYDPEVEQPPRRPLSYQDTLLL